MYGDISVRRLAEFVCRSGDLYAPSPGRPVEAEEGVALQKAVQAKRGATYDDYQREVALSIEFDCAGESKKLQGRADGLYLLDGMVIIEEFKACGELPSEADGVDQAQALVYAGLYGSDEEITPERPIQVQVVYVHADTQEEVTYAHVITAAQAQACLAFILPCYVTRLEMHQQRVTQRHAWAADLAFPKPTYRTSQQAIARAD